MRFTIVWETMVKRNPKLSSDDAQVTITAAQFRSALQQAYELGAKQERELIKAARDISQASRGQDIGDNIADVLKTMFGGRQ